MEGFIKRRNMTKQDIIRSALTSLRIADIEKASLFQEYDYDEPDEDYYDINFDPEDVLDPLQV